MIVANKLRETNRAEYLIYMWQLEDLLRQFDCNMSRLEQEYLSRFQFDKEVLRQTTEWYQHLCNMMLEENLRESGHLQINRNTLNGLEELHAALLKSEKFPYYKQMYYKVLPYVVEIRAKGGDGSESELYNCFEALYGVLLLRLQKKGISPATQQACTDISAMLGQLAEYFNKWKQGELELE